MTFQGSRVLLVEVDESVRTAVEIAFRGEGFDVMTRPDSTASSVVESFRPALAILDVRLAVGLEASADPRAAQARRAGDLLLTAADSVDDRLSGFRAGADDYIV